MEIQDQIRQIIEKRGEKLPVIDHKLNVLREMEERIACMEAMRKEMIAPDGSILPQSRFAPMLQKNPDMAWGLQALDFDSVRNALAEARGCLEAYRHRCARETVSISVVGKARCGKSELLKAISGLGNQVIPAFNSTDCTGAPSVIYNKPGSQLRAKLGFKTKEEMLQIARTYLKRILPDASTRPQLHTLDDIRTLDLDDISRHIPAGWGDGILMEYLAKLVEHYGEWAPYADSPSQTLYDESDIITFVAQNNGVSEEDERTTGRKRKEYYKYLVVDTCEITCSFPEAGIGSISLIDTVGLGDHTEGILDSMLQTVKERSDAVIFNHMPQNGAGGGLDKDIVEIYKSIHEKCEDMDLDKWMFYFINHIPVPTATLAKNTEYCQGALKQLKASRWAGADHAQIIDVMDTHAVRGKFLMPLLESLLKNLDSIDEGFREPALQALKVLQTEYGALCARAQKVLCSDIRSNASLAPLIHKLTEQSMVQLRTQLFSASRTWREKRSQPCAVLDHSAKAIFLKMTQTDMKGAYLPSMQEILDELHTGLIPNLLYTRYANSIRNRISRDFLDVDVELRGVIADMKNELAYALYETCGLKRVCAVSEEEGRCSYLWLRDFSESVLGNDYPNIRLAVETLANFEFSVKGFMTYEVRSCLDELDMNFRDVPPLVNPKNGDLKRTALSIYSTLHRTLCHLASTLEDMMKSLCVTPNCAMFAEVADFCDRIYYSEDSEMEWRNFYANQSSLLWSEELRQHQTVGVLFQEWLDQVEALQKYYKSAFYTL